MNKVILLGRIGQKVDFTKTPNKGTPVANFTLATNNPYNDKNGDKHETTEWHRIVAWNRNAEICRDYAYVGRECLIEGHIQNSKYEKNGQTHYSSKIVINRIRMIGPKDKPQKQAA